MKKQMMIVGGLAILCLILAITTIIFYQKASVLGKQNVVETSECSSIENQYFRDICYLQLAVGTPAHSYCKNMEISDLRDACYVEVSKLKKDNTICDFIDDKFYSRPKCYAELNILKNK